MTRLDMLNFFCRARKAQRHRVTNFSADNEVKKLYMDAKQQHPDWSKRHRRNCSFEQKIWNNDATVTMTATDHKVRGCKAVIYYEI